MPRERDYWTPYFNSSWAFTSLGLHLRKSDFQENVNGHHQDTQEGNVASPKSGEPNELLGFLFRS